MMLHGAKQMDFTGSSFEKLETHLCLQPNLHYQMKIPRNASPSGKNKQKTHLAQAVIQDSTKGPRS